MTARVGSTGAALFAGLMLVAASSLAVAEQSPQPPQPAAASGPAAAEAQPTPRAQPEPAAPPAAAAPDQPAEGQEQAGQGAQAAQADYVTRIGRIEEILLASEDPESTLEFGQEMAGDASTDTLRLRMLLGAAAMTLERFEDATTHFRRAVELSERGDPEGHLHALFNLARALERTGDLSEAAEALGSYVTFAEAHEGIDNHIEAARSRSTALSARAQRPRRRR